MENNYTSNPFNIPNANAQGSQSQPAAATQGKATRQAGFALNADGTYTPHTADGQPGTPIKATVTIADTATPIAPAQDFVPVLPPLPKSAAAIFDAFVELAKARINWEGNQLRASNNVLYALLDHCYGIFDLTQKSDDVREKFLELYKIKFPKTKAGTSIATKVIYAVFGKELEQRAATYSRVLRFALIEIKKTPSLTFLQFLAKFGGIEEVRRNGNGEAVQAKYKAKIASATAKLKAAKGLASSIAMLLPDDLQEKNEAHSFRAALLREDADGTFSVVMVSKSEGTVHTMLNEFENRSTEPAAKTQSQPESVQDTDDLARRIAANATL
jgi:hypothetical protein